MHIFIYNGKSSADFGLVISGEDTWKKPAPDVETVSVPGRNGDVIISNNRYNNIDITYHVGIKRDFSERYNVLINFIMSVPAYHRLEDSYHPDVFRLAALVSAVEPDVGTLNKNGIFDLTFHCKPQMFLKSGEMKNIYTSDGAIYNPTSYTALPLIRVYGLGELGIGQTTLTIADNDSYIDIDSDIEDAYRETANMNSHMSGSFPVLQPGSNGIRLGTGITRVEITPRWWRI